MKEIYFNNREGQTVLSAGERRGLNFDHVSSISELNQLEQMNINKGLLWLEGVNEPILTDSFMRKLHKKLFGEVWKWAGEYRKSEKNIGIEPWKVPTELNKLCKDAGYWIENKTYEWPEIIARFHHKLVYIHPFPNGNGRFSRIITNYLCLKNGQPIPHWHAKLPPVEKRKLYINALRKADMKNFEALINYFK